MTTIDPNTTLGAIVTAHPVVARELERRRLDYCCGGGRTLADVCRARDLDPVVVACELDAAVIGDAAEPADWANLSVMELVDHIEATHHAYLHDEFPRLSELMARVLRVHGDRHPELAHVAAGWKELRADLEPHLTKEERILFPMIRELATAPAAPSFHCGSLRNPISVMMREHDLTGELIAGLRTATADYRLPDDACESYRVLYRDLEHLEADTHLHIHKENNLLFPMVEQLEDERSR